MSVDSAGKHTPCSALTTWLLDCRTFGDGVAVILRNNVMTREQNNCTNIESPLVTVIMCVYNAGEYLRTSLLSIIRQTYQNLDIVIIDDGSTDGCFESVQDLLRDRRIRVFHQTNATKPVALNRGLDRAHGEFYAIQDADDVSYPTRVEKQVRTLLNRPQLAGVFCGNELIIDGKHMAPVFAPKCEADCKREIDMFRMPALDPTGMFRMSLVGDIRFDPSLQVAETFDYILRIGERHPLMVLGESLYGYRVLPNSLSRRDPMWRERFVIEAERRACHRRGLDYEREFPGGANLAKRSQNSVLDNNIAAHFMKSVLDQCRVGSRLAAFRTAWQCIRLHPLDPHYYKALVYALASPNLVHSVRRTFGTLSGSRK
jgi:glycosyltransferase involved in cell wall biosynthesis